MYFNDKTGKKKLYYKIQKIRSFPKILCIQFKRFTYDLKKIRNIIDYDESIDMGPYSTDKDCNKFMIYLV